MMKNEIGNIAVINFKCKKCGSKFDFETGKITFGMRLSFEKEIFCPKCGKRRMDDLELTELGQTQAGELYCREIKEGG